TGEIALFPSRRARGEGGVEVLDEQLAAVLGKELDVRAHGGTEVQHGHPAPADLFEERRERQRTVDIGLSRGRNRGLLLADTDAACRGKPAHQAVALTPAASVRTV